jgi:hypothetical protein
MNFFYTFISKFKSWWADKCPHPSVIAIFILLCRDVKLFYLKKDKSFKDLSFLYLKIIVVLEYVQFYCLSYTKTGRTVLILCGIVLIDSHPQDPVMLISIALWLLSYFVALSVSFYILMQFSINRKILIDILGKEVFESYISSNPASKALKNASLLISSIFCVGTGAAYANMDINTRAIQNKLDMLVKTSEKLNLTVSTQDITTILNRPDLNSSIAGKVFGGSGGTFIG